MKTTVFFALFSTAAFGQLLITPEPLGKGVAVQLSETHYFDSGEHGNLATAQFLWACRNDTDCFVGVGTNRFGEKHRGHVGARNQQSAGAGFNWNFYTTPHEKFRMSLFGMAMTPLTRAKEASTLLLNPAILAGYRMNKAVMLYTGAMATVPAGATRRGVFTPSQYRMGFPIGAAVTRGKWTLYLEYDAGRTLSGIGAGGCRVVPGE